MLSNEIINTITEDCEKNGYNIKLRDIAYITLCYHFESEKLAYKCIFDKDDLFEDYIDSPKINFLRSYIQENKLLSIHTKDEEITFQENKKEVEKLLDEAKEMRNNDELDANQYLQRCMDIRSKLNDKFDVKKEEKEQLVIVEKKYTSICPYCNHEIAIPTEDELIKKYGLISKENI